LRWPERPSTWFRLLLDLLTPRIIFVLVLWARVQCHMCSRMHIHTRASVTKKTPHVHTCSCRHMCPSSCPTAPIAIRPALSATTDEPRSIAAQPQAPRPAGSCEHPGNCGHLQPGTGAGVRAGPAWGQLQLPRSHRWGHVRRASSGPWPAGLLRGCGRLGLRVAGGWRKTQGTCASRPWRSSLRILPFTAVSIG
jgi:hypothetical protein